MATFRRSLVQHAKLAPVDREVTSLWPGARREPEDIIHVILYGHTGSGKTSYGHALVTRHARSVLADRDFIPVIWFRAPMPFTPREFCIQALSSGYNFPAPAHALVVHDDRHPVYYERHTEAALRRRLLEVAQITGTVVWIVDEIQHLQYGRGPLLEHLEWLKNLADEAGVMLVLTGTYEAIVLTTLNAQLIRRFRPILLDRYRTFRAKAPDADTRGFAILIQGLEDRLPLPQRSNLVAEAPRIFRYTPGSQIANCTPWPGGFTSMNQESSPSPMIISQPSPSRSPPSVSPQQASVDCGDTHTHQQLARSSWTPGHILAASTARTSPAGGHRYA